MWRSVADTHLKLLDRVVTGASFLTEGVLHIVDLWQYYVCSTRSGVTRCTLSMVIFLCRMCGCGVARDAVIAHRYTYVPSRCRTSQYRRTFIPMSVSPWNDLGGSVFDGVGLAVFKSRANVFFWPSYSLLFCLLLFSLSLLSFFGLVLLGWGLRTDRLLISFSLPCTTTLF